VRDWQQLLQLCMQGSNNELSVLFYVGIAVCCAGGNYIHLDAEDHEHDKTS
jgi:hypothetical protein